MSHLGELDYWEDIYKKSLSIHSDGSTDTNEWFVREGNRLIEKLLEVYPDEHRQKIKILDVGCGSGEFLCKLRDRGFTNLYGFDYSDNAIVLAKKNAGKSKISIKFITLNVENACEVMSTSGPFDVVFDKGTFDIFFCTDRVPTYTQNILPLISKNGRYFIVSCNATIDELIHSFCTLSSVKLELEHKFQPLQTFVFGNKKGHSTTSAMFKLEIVN
ncbi:Methyltransferase-like protein 10 [Babesia microti strain RI]|uniref:Methyltransferase-like protein 10 n=1 Tax=Babesia microti (strain RI) TaxID=1133968 RepID=I7IGH1_BABMR|nr:Methyltransferase-like protein 10 [Babesia microti strain RI]CCF73851.1 Methyltransferase-like protein 10 [Babesia microti strain RI]|eukprot:XP_012648460.1 Methyltransferase-like protein 10 [Babesia microti strain RI]